MAEITAAGYTALRNGPPPAGWFVELRDGAGDPVAVNAATRLEPVANDDTGSQTMTLTVEVAGSDLASLPVTVEGVVAYAADSGGQPLTVVEAFTPFVFGSPDDEATFRLHVQVPEQNG
ncbi:hypothetical protein G1H11_14090 [Phytoactinopolyspora alkaliphila]|uniref:Uncharacterized protein n=1 Tax=Phytoactinopolyspora alkaliphila TaxID=1783498 RepID=A0A6N9YN15_9ACTN|nr:hypothetical protein [Phytoactinopolyspora alkaliphila]NED96436.1 hypothetical protein [Phytoactinopolyspora alkaliphila]